MPVSFFQAVGHIRRFRPDVALGVGGYVTGPVMAAARFLGVPTVIHEQNSVPGLANRKLGRLVDRVCVSMPGSEGYFPAEKVSFCGNPVRENLLALAKISQVEGHKKPTVLVLGGSQGARVVNELVVEAFCGDSGGALAGIELIHQTGRADYEKVMKQYLEHGRQAEVAPFFQDMAEVYARADLLVSRAGATTLTELAVLGKPAILIPYPYAADNHQKKNGDYYVDGGGAVMFDQNTLIAADLAVVIAGLAADRGRLQEMALAMKRLARPDAAERIVDICLEAARITG